MRVLLVIFVTVLLDLVGFGIVIPLLSFYAEDHGATPFQATLLMASYSLAQFLFSSFWGGLSDRFGRRPILLMSIGATALALAGFAQADALWQLFLFRTLHGVFAANISTAQACIADVTAPENRAKGLGMLGAGFGLGFTLGPFIGGEFSAPGDHSLPIWIAAGLSAFNFLLALVILPETRKPDSTTQKRRFSIDILKHPAVGSAILLAFATTGAFAMMESTFALYEEHQNGLTAKDIGRVLGTIGVVGIAVQGGLVGRLARTVGERRLVQVGLTGLALSLLLLPFASPWPPLLGVAVLLAIFQGVAQPSLQALVSRGAPAEDQGFILGTNQAMGALARAVSPALGGLLFTAWPLAPYGVAALILLVAVATVGPRLPDLRRAG